MSKDKFSDRMPDYIGNYKIIGRLGKGGMGDIYKAVQEPLNRIVALKVLPPQLSRDDEFSKRFEVEAKAISLLEHQNIVNIYEYGDYEFGDGDGYRFIAMQFIDGMDLGKYITDTKRIAIADIIDFSKQICRGLRYAHGRNVIHRDIKPQNVLLDKNKVIHITDFGIAKIFSDSVITLTGSTIGTPEYMSPEQAQGKKIDAQSDIYSLGILMYEMLTGKPPFIAPNSMAVAYKQVHEAPPPPSSKRRDTPKLMELIIQKALKKDKRDRYESVGELLEDLDKVDPSERAERPTVQLRQPITKSFRPDQLDGGASGSERRIIDRRSGDKRRCAADLPVNSWGYWRILAKTQWPSWAAIAALGAALLWHVAAGK